MCRILGGGRLAHPGERPGGGKHGTGGDVPPDLPSELPRARASSRRLAAGPSPAGEASPRPPIGRAFLQVRARSARHGEAPDTPPTCMGRFRGCPAVTGISRVAVSHTCRSFRRGTCQPAPGGWGRSPAASWGGVRGVGLFRTGSAGEAEDVRLPPSRVRLDRGLMKWSHDAAVKRQGCLVLCRSGGRPLRS